MKRTRAAFDDTMIAWADALEPAWLEDDLTYYSGGAKRDITGPKWLLVTHMFKSPDAPSRPGALHADPGGRQAARHRFAVDGGVTG
jgi:hypothetical protein